MSTILKKETLQKTIIGILIFTFSVVFNTHYAKAETNVFSVDGYYYQSVSEDELTYEESASNWVKLDEKQSLGKVSVNGEVHLSEEKQPLDSYYFPDGTKNVELQSFLVKNGKNFSITYEFDDSKLGNKKTDWHLIKKNPINIDISSSLDATEYWNTDISIEGWKKEDKEIYTSKNMQMVNGCYFEVLVSIGLERNNGEIKVPVIGKKIKDKYEHITIIEQYLFYAQSDETNDAISPEQTPRKTVGEEAVNTGKDNGFSKAKDIDVKDPHYGWTIGKFFINGYTSETNSSEGTTPVFLKNVGDKVTLWFKLTQDIDALNGNSKLSIAEDRNGYDKEFQTKKTNFGYGALIIQYTDREGEKHLVNPYTDFLAACSTTTADTRVQLFEEGDYEVHLDYEIKQIPMKVGAGEVMPSYHDYQISFKFSIRNGNCMAYPFDISTGNELSDIAITENGFMLDLARSRYLQLNVIHSVIKVGADGLLSEDTRFNRPAQDGEEYTEEGIYTFDVTNLYTNQHTTKTIYVGSDSYLKALSKVGISVDELNEKLVKGAKVSSDGTIQE